MYFDYMSVMTINISGNINLKMDICVDCLIDFFNIMAYLC